MDYHDIAWVQLERALDGWKLRAKAAESEVERLTAELAKLRTVADTAALARRMWFRNRSELATLEAMEALDAALAALETR
jgi:hypothetical protein